MLRLKLLENLAKACAQTRLIGFRQVAMTGDPDHQRKCLESRLRFCADDGRLYAINKNASTQDRFRRTGNRDGMHLRLTMASMLAASGLLLAGCQGATSGGSSPAPAPTASPNYAALDAQQLQSERALLAAPSAPQARLVASIAAMLEPVVTKDYHNTPFGYYVETESVPDAESYYGPRVYISVGMVNFADNREEVAGVLCHESAHVLHYDGINSDQTTRRWNDKVAALIARHHGLYARFLDKVGSFSDLRYSRKQESDADKAGATICDRAHFNPWGLVWMLRKLQQKYPTSRLSYLSNHPSNQARVSTLVRYLRHNSEFQVWPGDEKFATKK